MVNVLYITSQSHSGSTLLTLLLGAHSHVAAPGELKGFSVKATRTYIRKYRPNMLDADDDEQRRILLSRPCTCGAPSFNACPYWQSIDHYLRTHHRTSLQTIDVETADHATFAQHNTSLFEVFESVSGMDWIVDSSKSVSRLLRLRDVAGLNLVIVHLYRDPFGVVYSAHKRGRPWFAATREYLKDEWTRHRALRGIPHVVVSYEQLVRQPEATITRVQHAMGLQWEPQQLRWTEHKQHSFQGNKMRFSTDSTIREDRAWRTGLNWRQRSVIAAMMLPLRLARRLPW